MTPREHRLVAVLTELRNRLGGVIDQTAAGKLTREDQIKLAAMFELIARDFRPTVVPPDDAGDSGSR